MLYSYLLSIAMGMASVQTPSDTLAESRISAEKLLIVSSRDTVQLGMSLSPSEALQNLPGLQLGDMGGTAGLKTVGFRGLGSAHTTINIDGIRSVNVQSGQNDLGMLNIDDYTNAVVDYATNSITFNTARPSVSGGRGRFRGGSFGSYELSGEYGVVFNNLRSIKLGVNGVKSEGDFTMEDGSRRSGNDIGKLQLGMDYFSDKTHVKAYYNGSDRGTPGSVSWPSDDRQKDDNAFVQASWSDAVGENLYLKANSRLSYDKLDYSTSYGNSLYKQYAALANLTATYKLSDILSFRAMLDLEADHLSSDYEASRFSAKPGVAAFLETSRFRASANMDYIYTSDKGNTPNGAVSPALQLRYQLAKQLAFTAFGRRAYRIPTFNDLYFVGSGNPDLKPEDAWLSDAGLMYSIGNIDFSANLFYNVLTDKITWAPTEEDPNIWLPYNVGRVECTGTDLSLDAGYSVGDMNLDFIVKYSYTKSLDKTEGSYSFNQQTPYIPRNSIYAAAELSCRKTALLMAWNSRSGRIDSYGDLPDWNTLDLTLRQIVGRNMALCLYGRNLLDYRYELSSGYPMPGRSFCASIEVVF